MSTYNHCIIKRHAVCEINEFALPIESFTKWNGESELFFSSYWNALTKVLKFAHAAIIWKFMSAKYNFLVMSCVFNDHIKKDDDKIGTSCY